MDTTIENRRASNTLVPIAKLNDDILSHIFMFNAHIDFVHPHIPSTTIRRTSQVYQRWRDLLLNYPLVWAASLEFNDPQPWIEIVLSRAGATPLNIVLPSISHFLLSIDDRREAYQQGLRDISSLQPSYFQTPPSIDQLDFALSLLPKCRQLIITVDSEAKAKTVAAKVALLAGPNLEECVLTMFPHYDVSIWEKSDISVDIGPSILRLKWLHLDGYWTDFFSPIFQNLTKLHVSNMSYGRTLEPSEWLRVLRRLPQLEELGLNDAITRLDNPSPGNSTCPIVLSHLQLLILQGDCTSCHEILSQIQFPASCALSIWYSRVDYLHTYSAVMIELCKKVQLSVQFHNFEGLSLEISRIRRSSILQNRSHARFNDKTFYIDYIVLDMETYERTLMLPELAMEIIRTVSPSVRDLGYRLSGFEEISSQAAVLLELFEQVQTLRLQSLDALTTITSMHYRHGFISNPKTLPSLSRIYFYYVQLDSDTADAVQDVVDLARKRSDIKAPISHILLKDCWGSLQEALMTKLKDMGVETELDDETTVFRLV